MSSSAATRTPRRTPLRRSSRRGQTPRGTSSKARKSLADTFLADVTQTGEPQSQQVGSPPRPAKLRAAAAAAATKKKNKKEKKKLKKKKKSPASAKKLADAARRELAAAGTNVSTNDENQERPPAAAEEEEDDKRRRAACVNAVYKLVRRRTGKLGGGGAGGAIYGEVTQKSFARIVDLLKTKCELDSSSTFIDIGAGLGKPNLHVALDPGVKASVGVELGGERWWQSMDILWHGLEAKTAAETGLDALPGSVFFAHADFLEVDSLDAFSHVYMFDKGFPPVLMEHIAEVFNSSAQSRYLVCFKKPSIIVRDYGFRVEEVGRVRTSMSGSGEGNTCFI